MSINKEELSKIKNIGAVGGIDMEKSTLAESIMNLEEEKIKESSKLSEDDIKEIEKTLKENLSSDSKLLREIQEGVKHPHGIFNREGIEKAEANVEVLPSGEMRIVSMQNNTKDIAISEINEEVINDTHIDDEKYEKLFKDFGMDEKDLFQLIDVCKRYKKGEKFSIYNSMPESIKVVVRRLAQTTDRVTIQAVAKEFLNYMISQIDIEREIVSFQDSLKKELDMPGLVDMYAEHLKDMMENKLEEKANQIRDHYPDKANQLMEVIEYFKDSYTLRRQKDILLNDTTIHSKLRKGIKRFDKICRDINYKYQNNSLSIKDINLILPVLDRKLDKEKYTYDNIMKFVVLYYEITKNMKPEDIKEHTFMYYSITHILYMDHVDITKSKFNQELLSNIEEVLDMIKAGEK